jgi:hypothetical protein
VKAKPWKIACTSNSSILSHRVLFKKKKIPSHGLRTQLSPHCFRSSDISTRKFATLCLIYTSRVRVLSIVHVHRLDLIRVHERTSTQDDNPSKAPQLLLVRNRCSPRSFRIFSDPRVAPPTCCKLVKLYYSYVLPCRFAQTGQMRG